MFRASSTQSPRASKFGISQEAGQAAGGRLSQARQDRVAGARNWRSRGQFGFASWRKLNAHIASLAQRPAPARDSLWNLPHVFRDVMKAVVRRDDEALTRLLGLAPEVINHCGPHPEWGGRPQPLHVATLGNRNAFNSLLEAGPILMEITKNTIDGRRSCWRFIGSAMPCATSY